MTTLKHHKLAPSSFPAWARCPAFDSDPTERADAMAGTVQHAALAGLLGCQCKTPCGSACKEVSGLSPEAREAVTWAADYIRALAAGNRIETERRVSYTVPDTFAGDCMSEVFSGTADAIIIHPPGNLADLLDFKSGADERDHRPQLAGYALALFSMRTRLKTIRAHVLYGRVRRVDTWAMTQADAAGIVHPILDARQKLDRRQTACDYCTFCAHRTTCPAITGQVEAVARTAPAWEDLAPAIRDPSAITDPTLAAKALTLARFVSTWAEAIRTRATELAKGGAILPGYRLQERRGGREVTDLDAAFTRTGLTPGQFVSACKLSLPKLGDAYATARGLSKAAAAREIETTLADLIREGTSTVSLVVERGSAS